MSDFHRSVTAAHDGSALGQPPVAVDEGLRSYMLQIYNYMLLGLVITGLASFGIYVLSVTADPAGAMKVLSNGAPIPVPVNKTLFLTPLGYYIFVSPLKWLIMLLPLALVLALSFRIDRLRPATAQTLFWIYAALVGCSLATIFFVFTHASIVRVFFITAAAFGAASLWGYTTQRELSCLGAFLLMSLFGIGLASLVTLFAESSMLQFAVSTIGVLVFAGLTAWDTQRLKHEYLYGVRGEETQERRSILGALSLYLSFINLFALLEQLLGQREA